MRLKPVVWHIEIPLMTKKDLKPRAKELYVVHQMSLADISRQLSISTRTLQNWKAEDNWEIERSQLSGSEKSFHAELFALGEVMTRKIKQDEINGIPVAPERYTALQRIIDTAEKSRKYETAAPKESKDELSPAEKQAKVLKEMKRLMGI